MILKDHYKILHNGSDITSHVLRMERKASICSGEEIVTLDTDLDETVFNPFDKIEVFENGDLVKTFYLNTVSRKIPDASTTIEGSDLKRIRDYFIAETYLVDYPSTVRYWIEKFITEAGANVIFTEGSTGGLLSNNTSLGMMSLYEQLQYLLQIAGWYMRTDAQGNIVIGSLLALHSPKAVIDNALSFQRNKDDHILRNRVVVWGSGSKNYDRWVFADLRTNVKWQIDGNDIRSVVVANSNIPTKYEAYKIANKALKEFATISDIKIVKVPGISSLNLGDIVSLNIWKNSYRGIVRLTSYTKTVSNKGAIETLVFDEKCPRLFAYWNWGFDYIYIATNSGILRKPMIVYSGDNYLWEDYSQGILEDDLYMDTVKVNNGNLISISKSGNCYYRNIIDSYWIPVNSGIVDGGISLLYDSLYLAHSGNISKHDLFGRLERELSPLPSGENIVSLDSIYDIYFLTEQGYGSFSHDTTNYFHRRDVVKYDKAVPGILSNPSYISTNNIVDVIANAKREPDAYREEYAEMEKFSCRITCGNTYQVVVVSGNVYTPITYNSYYDNYMYDICKCNGNSESVVVSFENFSIDGNLSFQESIFYSDNGYIYGVYSDNSSKYILKYLPGDSKVYKTTNINVEKVIPDNYSKEYNITWGVEIYTEDDSNYYLKYQKCNLDFSGCVESLYSISNSRYERLESEKYIVYVRPYTNAENSILDVYVFDKNGLVEHNDYVILRNGGDCPSNAKDYEIITGYDPKNKRTVGILIREMFLYLPDNTDTDFACDEWLSETTDFYSTDKWNKNPYFIVIVDNTGFHIYDINSFTVTQPFSWLPPKDLIFQNSVPGNYCGYGNKMRTPGTHITQIDFENDENRLWLRLKVRGWGSVDEYSPGSTGCDSSGPKSGFVTERVFYSDVSNEILYTDVPKFVKCILFQECSIEDYIVENAIGANEIINYYIEDLYESNPYWVRNVKFDSMYKNYIAELILNFSNGNTNVYIISNIANPVYEGNNVYSTCFYCYGRIGKLVFGEDYYYTTVIVNNYDLVKYTLYKFTDEDVYEEFDKYIVASGIKLLLSLGYTFPVVYQKFGGNFQYVSYDKSSHIIFMNDGMATFPREGENVTLSGIVDRYVFSIGTTDEKLFATTFSGIINNESMYNYNDKFDIPITDSGYYKNRFRLMEASNFTIRKEDTYSKVILSNGKNEIFENFSGCIEDCYQDVWENLDDFGVEDINYIAVDDDL